MDDAYEWLQDLPEFDDIDDTSDGDEDVCGCGAYGAPVKKSARTTAKG